MSAADMQFRTAAFGGFQKQDVMDYVEKANREHTEQLEACRRELDEVSQQRSRLEEENTENQRRVTILTGEKEQMEQRLNELEAENKRLSAEMEELSVQTGLLQEQLDAAVQEREKSAAAVARMEPAAQAYECLKDKTAGIELEAHQRAQGILNVAEQQADQAREDTLNWLQKVRAQYEELCANLTQAAGNASEQLLQMSETLEGLQGQFSHHEEDLEKLVSTFETHIPHMPEPLPLDE